MSANVWNPGQQSTLWDSVNIPYLAAGFGAITTNVRDKLRETVSVKDFGVVGDGVADDTTAFQNAINAAIDANNKTLHIPSGNTYKITGTLIITQGVMLVAEGSQGSAQDYGTTIIHYSNSDLFVWNGNGIANKGTGGGLKNVLLLKASGYAGGNAIKLLATDDNHRPGEMIFDNVLIYGISSAQWDRGLLIDGSACTTSGSKGVRSVNLRKFRVSSCQIANEYISINQGVHIATHHVQVDQGAGTGACGITITGDSDNLLLSGIICNGNLIINGSSATNVILSGNISTLDVNNTLVQGFAGIRSTGITNASINFRVSSNIADAFLGIKTATTANVTGDNTFYRVVYDTEKFDKNNSFSNTTGVFTCKVSGIYAFSAVVGYNALGAAHVRHDSYLLHKDSGGTPIGVFGTTGNAYACSSSGGNFTAHMQCQVEMVEGDTMEVQSNVSGGAKTVGIYGSALSNGSAYFSGHLLA